MSCAGHIDLQVYRWDCISPILALASRRRPLAWASAIVSGDGEGGPTDGPKPCTRISDAAPGQGPAWDADAPRGPHPLCPHGEPNPRLACGGDIRMHIGHVGHMRRRSVGTPVGHPNPQDMERGPRKLKVTTAAPANSRSSAGWRPRPSLPLSHLPRPSTAPVAVGSRNAPLREGHRSPAGAGPRISP